MYIEINGDNCEFKLKISNLSLGKKFVYIRYTKEYNYTKQGVFNATS